MPEKRTGKQVTPASLKRRRGVAGREGIVGLIAGRTMRPSFADCKTSALILGSPRPGTAGGRAEAFRNDARNCRGFSMAAMMMRVHSGFPASRQRGRPTPQASIR